MSAEKQYERLTQQFLADMARVKAPVADYLAALKAAREELDMVIDAATNDAAREEG
jgi:hypothetical protein